MIRKFPDFDEYQLGKYNKQKKKPKGNNDKKGNKKTETLPPVSSSRSDDEAELEKLSFTLKQVGQVLLQL